MNMKSKLLIGLLTLSHLSIADAKFFRCDFTEPFFNLLISTDSKIVTYLPEGGPSEGFYSKKIKVDSIKNKNNQILINNNIKISNNVIGSNGMSDHSYPYLIEYIDEAGISNFGGCKSEEKHYSTLISRIPSFDNFGLTMVNYWPGEYGHVTGFKAIKETVIPADQTYLDIERAEPEIDSKSCTIKKGKMFIPSLGTKGEIYATIFKTRKFVAQSDFNETVGNKRTIKKGDVYFELAYASEGYCFVETNGKVDTSSCFGNEDAVVNGKPLFQEVDAEGKPITTPPNPDDMAKEYVFTQCQDGHWTWIPTDYMSKSKDFSSAHDPSLDDDK